MQTWDYNMAPNLPFLLEGREINGTGIAIIMTGKFARFLGRCIEVERVKFT